MGNKSGLTVQQLINSITGMEQDAAGVSVSNMKMPSASVLETLYGVPANVANLLANQKLTYSVNGTTKPITTGSEFNEALFAARNQLLGSAIAMNNGVSDAAIKSGFQSFLTKLHISGSGGANSMFTDALRTYASMSGDWTKILKSADTLYNPAHTVSILSGAAGTNYAAMTNATASEQASAYNTVMSTLNAWGLDASPEVDGLVKRLVNIGANSPSLINPGEILQQVRATQAYQDAFPGLNDRNNDKSIPASEHMTEQAYMNYIASIQGTAQQYGLPNLTQGEITSLVKGNVSASEFNARVVQGYAAAANADPAVKAQLANFGINTSDLAHYYLDPKNSITKLQQQTAAATLAGYSKEIGLQGLSNAGAIELANRVNLGAASGQSGYGTQSMASIQNALLGASKDAALQSNTPGATSKNVDTNTIIGAQIAGFQGTNQVEAQTRVMRAEQAKVAPFEQGGGYLETNKGVIGVGSART